MDGEITIGELNRTLHRVEQKLDNHNRERKLDNQDHEDRLRRIEKWMYGVGAVSFTGALSGVGALIQGATGG